MLKSKKQPEIKTVTAVKVVTNPMEAMIIDSDNDGLKDWEETLWKLDPHKADSNGDGVLDVEEVQKRIKEIDTNALKNDTGDITGNQYTKDTETDIISKKLFAEYINLKQSGNFNEETINATANKLVEEQLNNKKTTVYYSLKKHKNFSIRKQSSFESLRQFSGFNQGEICKTVSSKPFDERRGSR